MAGGLVLLVGIGYLLGKNQPVTSGSPASKALPVALPHTSEAVAPSIAMPDSPQLAQLSQLSVADPISPAAAPPVAVATLPVAGKILQRSDTVRVKVTPVTAPDTPKALATVAIKPTEVASSRDRAENTMPVSTMKRAEKRDVTLAMSQFNDAARQDVTNIMSQFNEAVRAGDFDAAKILRDKIAAGLGVNSLVTLRMHAFLALKMGELDLAKTDYEKVLAGLPNDYEANLNLAVIDTQQGNPELSKKRSKQMLEIYPDDAVFKVLAN